MDPILVARLIGGAVIAAILAGGFFYVKGKFDDAAKVPGLEQTIKDKQATIDYWHQEGKDLNNQLVKVQAERDSYHDQLSAWHGTVNRAADALAKDGKNAEAAKNSICFPTDAERKLRNDFLSNFGSSIGKP